MCESCQAELEGACNFALGIGKRIVSQFNWTSFPRFDSCVVEVKFDGCRVDSNKSSQCFDCSHQGNVVGGVANLDEGWREVNC